MSEAPVQVVLCTCPDAETADAIAARVVEARLAACVNILPGITSVYRWQGRIERDTECLLVIKTTAPRIAALSEAIVAAHPHELPEVIAVPVTDGLKDYLAWVRAAVSTAG